MVCRDTSDEMSRRPVNLGEVHVKVHSTVVSPETESWPSTTVSDRDIALTAVAAAGWMAQSGLNRRDSLAEAWTLQVPADEPGVACHQVTVSLSTAPSRWRWTVTRFAVLENGKTWLNSVLVRKLLTLRTLLVAGSPWAGPSRSSAMIFLNPWNPRPPMFSMASW